MEAKLNIYADCITDTPTKTYVCKRLLLKVSKKVSSLVETMKGKSESDQEKITIDVIKTIFPDFKDEEFDSIDPIEWLNFVNEVTKETNQILANASKNEMREECHKTLLLLKQKQLTKLIMISLKHYVQDLLAYLHLK